MQGSSQYFFHLYHWFPPKSFCILFLKICKTNFELNLLRWTAKTCKLRKKVGWHLCVKCSVLESNAPKKGFQVEKNINHFIITNYNVKSPWRMNTCICNLFDYAAWNLKGSMSKQLRIPHNTNTTFFYGRLDMSQILLCVHKGISRQKSVRYIQWRAIQTTLLAIYEVN